MKKSNQKYMLLAVIGFVLGGFFGLMNVEADNLAFSFLWGGLIIATAFIGAGWLFGNKDDGDCFLTIGAI